MFNPSEAMICNCIDRLQTCYRQTFGNRDARYGDLVGEVADQVLRAIAHSDALYHNLEHTILVTLTGQEILRGKQIQKGTVSCRSWAHFIISLLCHDIGYIKGICRHDNPKQRTYATGVNGQRVQIAPGATDASLAPYHVDRSKLFVAETFANEPLLVLAAIQHTIELTRFPIPADKLYQETGTLEGLARAADLIGQFSDPHYLEKLPALFHEFEEVGTNQMLGYNHPGEMRTGYPAFFRNVIYPYIWQACQYLKATPEGRQIRANLHANVFRVEQELEDPNLDWEDSLGLDIDAEVEPVVLSIGTAIA